MARRTKWTGASADVATAGVTIGSTIILADSDVLMESGHTLLRIRGELGVSTDVDRANPVRLAAGIIQLTAGATIAATPSPFSDHDADWVWHQPIVLTIRDSPTAATPRRMGSQYLIDNKAMRKMRDHTDLVLVVASSLSIAHSWSIACRLLFALP